MFDTDHKGTFESIYSLWREAKKENKPITVWVGSGASAWAGFPLWAELAEELFTNYNRSVRHFDVERARRLIDSGKYPEFFEICRNVDISLYCRMLDRRLGGAGRPPPVYQRFLNALNGISPVGIVSTNVDLMLEGNFEGKLLTGGSLALIPELIQNRSSFVAKIHGSISNIDSIVFTKSDYDSLVSNAPFLHAIGEVFRRSTVLFVGYSLSDEYLVDLLRKNEALNESFGIGPHFICSSIERSSLPDCVRLIKYIPSPHKDHRTAIQLIEELRRSSCDVDLVDRLESPSNSQSNLVSAHILSDFVQEGTWTTSQRVEAKNSDGKSIVFHHGGGIQNGEIEFKQTSAIHDLVIGLLCFDLTYVPITHIGRLHKVLGAPIFEMLVFEGVLRFLWLHGAEIVIFQKDSGRVTQTGPPKQLVWMG